MGRGGRVLSFLGQMQGNWTQFRHEDSQFTTMIHAVVTVDGILTKSEVEKTIRKGFGDLDAFTCLLKQNDRKDWFWEDCLEDYSVMQNVQFLEIEMKIGGIDAVMEEILSWGLIPNLPPWRGFVFEIDGKTIFVFKFHHCISDGAGLSQVLARMVDGDLESEIAKEIEIATKKRLTEHQRKSKSKSLTVFLMDYLIFLAAVFYSLLKLVMFTFQVKTNKDWIFARDDETHPSRKFVKAPAIDLKTFDKIRSHFGGTLNDLLLAACSGAFRRYAIEIENVADVPSSWSSVTGNGRYLIPGAQKAHFLDNYSAAFVVKLPTDLETPATRLKNVRTQMDIGKHGCESVVSYYMVWFFNWVTSPQFCSAFLQWAASGSTFLISNVRGPAQRIFVHGKRVLDTSFVVSGGSTTLSACLYTYDGSASLSLLIDGNKIKNPDIIAKFFVDEIELYRKLAEVEG